MVDIIPSNFWRFPVLPSVWEEISDLDNWFSSLPTYGMLNGLSVSEDGKNVYVEASIPGVDPKDIDVTFHNGVLWIKGSVKEEEKDKKYYRKASSAFSYRIAIPKDINTHMEPQAECENGVMKVTFAKSPKSLPKKIVVKSSVKEKQATKVA